MPKAQVLKLPTKKRREFLRKAADRYVGTMGPVIPYLENRGITTKTATQWRLGYVADPMPGHEDYLGRLAIPYLTPAGPMMFKFRCIQEHDCKESKCPKYLGEPGEIPRLFGVWNFRHDETTLYLTEGELDAIAATQAGLRAVGVPGATQWMGYWDHLFEGYDEVVLLRDGDQAGRAMSDLVASRLANCRTVKMPEGEDVSSFVTKNGEEALRERVKV